MTVARRVIPSYWKWQQSLFEKRAKSFSIRQELKPWNAQLIRVVKPNNAVWCSQFLRRELCACLREQATQNIINRRFVWDKLSWCYKDASRSVTIRADKCTRKCGRFMADIADLQSFPRHRTTKLLDHHLPMFFNLELTLSIALICWLYTSVLHKKKIALQSAQPYSPCCENHF